MKPPQLTEEQKDAVERLKVKLTVRTHRCLGDEEPEEKEGTLRRTGREVVNAMRGKGKLCGVEVHKLLPHLSRKTLYWRLRRLVESGDVLRDGERRHYVFYLPEEK